MMNHPHLIAYLTLTRYELARIMRIWIQAFVPPMINTLLYFVIFGEIMGQRIGSVHGVPYVQFIAPGLMMMTVITNAYANVTSSFYITKLQRSIEEMLISPMPPTCMMLAYISGGVCRGLISAVIVLVISQLFTALVIHNIWLVFTITLLTAALFAQAGFTNALQAKSFDDTTIVVTFLLTPMIYLGGVFYSVTFLSETWQAYAYYNPILYIVNALRYGFLGVTDVPISPTLWGLLTANGLLFLLNRHLLVIGYGLRE